MTEAQAKAYEEGFLAGKTYVLAEMEKRLMDLLPLGLDDCDCWVKDVKHFLATALEEQRVEYVRKVEAYIDAKYPPNRFADSSTGIMTRGVQEPTHVRMMGVEDGQTFNALEHVLAILNGKE